MFITFGEGAEKDATVPLFTQQQLVNEHPDFSIFRDPVKKLDWDYNHKILVSLNLRYQHQVLPYLQH